MSNYPPPGPPAGPPPGYNSYPPAPAHGQNPYQGQSQNPYNNNAQAPAQNNDYYNPPVDNGNAYVPPQNNMNTGYVPPQGNNTGYDASYKVDTPFEEKFAVTKPKYNDLWAAVLFILTVFGLIAVSVLSIRGYAETRDVNGSGIYDDDGNNFGLSTNTLILLCFVLGMSAVVSAGYLFLTKKFTKAIIWISGIANIALGIGTAIYYLYKGNYSAGIVFLIFGVFYAFCFFSWRSRFPFAILMLRKSINIAQRFGHVWIVSGLGGLLALATGAWFSVAFVSIYTKYSPGNNPGCQVSGGGCSSAKLIGILVFTTFGFYWLTEVIKNVIHVSISGVYGSWYFCSKSGMPKHPTIGAFKRSMTYSFGSICFGSLLVSIIQLIKQAASLARSQTDGIIWAIVMCLITFIISIVQWLAEFFNQYAFSYIALYGDAFIPAAKATWRMMKDRGIDALINDCIVDPVLTMGAVCVGYLSALLAYLYLQFTDPVYNRDGAFTPVIMAFSFLIGLQVANIILIPIKSGVSTIFTSMAHSPEVLMKDHPEFYREMVQVYPHVQQVINV